MNRIPKFKRLMHINSLRKITIAAAYSLRFMFNGMEHGFLSQKGSGGERGVKEKDMHALNNEAVKDGVVPSVSANITIFNPHSLVCFVDDKHADALAFGCRCPSSIAPAEPGYSGFFAYK
ncbi:hypothetical protein Tco_0193690 [Tanacetum coccineum]